MLNLNCKRIKMKSQKLINQIIADLKAVANPARKEKLKTYLPTSMEVFGVSTPDLRDLSKKLWVELKTWPPEKLIGFAKELVATRIIENNHFAYDFLWRNKKALDLLTLADLKILGRNMDNWGTTDSFAVMLSGRAWRKNQISDADVLNWLKTGNRWWRRAAVVSTVGLNLKSRGGTGDTRRTLMVCEKVVGDRDDMMVKALSWALRELSKSDKPAVEKFMETYKPRLAGRVVREVTSKLATGLKSGKRKQ